MLLKGYVGVFGYVLLGSIGVFFMLLLFWALLMSLVIVFIGS